jgi:diguanylate cyclase (GGDEF)-like protein/PAS domain S-box-containing protein
VPVTGSGRRRAGAGEPSQTTEALRESEARLQALLSSLDDLVFELDENGKYLGVWTTDDALLIAPRSELLGRTVREALGDEAGIALIEVIRRVLDTGSPELWEYCLDVPAGVRWFQGRVAPIAGPEGASSGRICLLVRDITVQKVAEEAISRSLSREQLLSRLSETLPVGLFQIDTAGHITFTNDRLHAIVGRPPADTIETQLSPVVAEDRPVFEGALLSVLANEPVDDIEVRLRVPAAGGSPAVDSERVCLLSLRALTDGAGVVTGAVGCLSDVTDRVQLRRELEVRASVDTLTSCLNREASLELLRRTTAATGATGEGGALIFIDLDRFKAVNDEFGHAAGDRLLAAAAERLRGAVRDCDDVGRLGGDEFLVICPRVESSDQAVAIAERIAAATTAAIDVGPAVVELRTSVGVAWTREALDADAFIAQADSAMYESKRTGRRGVSLFTVPSDDTRGTTLEQP